MQYTIDEQGIHYQIEDDEADRVARIVEQRRLVAIEPEKPPISLTDAIATCQRISAEIEAIDIQMRAVANADTLPFATLDDCECDRIGVKKCGMCE